MMLHEAVMLEIYRQALNASELASPRCLSRESNGSAIHGDVRCASNDSHCSGNESNVTDLATVPNSPTVGLPLPASLTPSAAAALLPPQSAAMAAYLNVAAAAAVQQNHLLLTNPLAAAASLVHQATQSHSPNTPRLTPSSSGENTAGEGSVLDFSTKSRSLRESENGSDEVIDDLKDNATDDKTEGSSDDVNRPLDLSLGPSRKRQSFDEEAEKPNRKILRNNDYKSLPPGTWVPPINPYLAAVAAASFSPNTPVPVPVPLSLDWNSKQKISPNEATKALEKMTEMTRLGSATTEAAHSTPPTTRGASGNMSAGSNSTPSGGGGRHSAWQSHWLNKGADAAKDVFKCVWCKQSFPTLASLTTHMKETQHCSVNVPPPSGNTSSGLSNTSNSSSSNSHNNNNSNSGASQNYQSHHHTRHSSSQSGVGGNNSSGSASSATSSSSSSSKTDLNLLIKETMPLPRKLVRGQDVWLGKGAEQTRQILKCMWCGQSFRSLAEMTSHMQETQHYTNIISQEQIISWKSHDDKNSNGSSSNGASLSPAVTSPPAVASSVSSTGANSTVSAVLTCKVCDQAFTTLKDLSNHMVKNSHYKDPPVRPTTESPQLSKRGRQSREKRKKSLPVRKLLELERAQQDFKLSNSLDPALKPLRDFAASTKITCEKCGSKIETALFVEHIRQCLGGNIPMSPRNAAHHHNHNNNNTMKTSFMNTVGNERMTSAQITLTASKHNDGRKTVEDNNTPLNTDILYPMGKESEKTTSSPSVLNAIEQLIEKSFDTRNRQSTFGGANQPNTPLGSSILKRLGIDDTVDYTKPLIDAQTMHFLRSYSNYSSRDRSASESSSVSERCSSRLESVTPERNSELSRQTTPRHTPDKSSFAQNDAVNLRKEAPLDVSVKIKTEPNDVNAEKQHTENECSAKETQQKISVKKEFSMSDDNEREVTSIKEEATEFNHEFRVPTQSPRSRPISPNTSERSLTPKSASSLTEKKISPGGGSLTALSSMFDNLGSTPIKSNANTVASGNLETNNNHSNAKKPNANPLAALQKLCDTTDTPAANTRSNSANSSLHAAATTNGCGNGSGSMVAFSWACNDAVMTSDSIIKCSFCDTPFCSKGAYRHHLSKVHFVKETSGADNDSQSSMAQMAMSPKSMTSPKSSSKSPVNHRQTTSPAATAAPIMPPVALTPTSNPFTESPQSKFLKYTELAKQLSSKNA